MAVGHSNAARAACSSDDASDREHAKHTGAWHDHNSDAPQTRDRRRERRRRAPVHSPEPPRHRPPLSSASLARREPSEVSGRSQGAVIIRPSACATHKSSLQGRFLKDLAPPRAGFSFCRKSRRVRRQAEASRGDGRKSAPGGNLPYDDVSAEAPAAVSAILPDATCRCAYSLRRCEAVKSPAEAGQVRNRKD